MIMFALQLHKRVYLAVTKTAAFSDFKDLRSTGLRPYRWTRDVSQALPFGSIIGAMMFAENFKGVPFDIVPVERDLGASA